MPAWAIVLFDLTLDTLKTMAMFFLIKTAVAKAETSGIHLFGITPIVAGS